MRSSSALLCVVLVGCQVHAQPAPPDAKAAVNQPAAYVGSEVCQACHEDIFNAIQKSPHQAIERVGTLHLVVDDPGAPSARKRSPGRAGRPGH